MPGRRTVLTVLLILAAHAAARCVDAGVGLLLHTTLDLPGFVGEALGLVDGGDLARSIGGWMAGGAAGWLLLAAIRRRVLGETMPESLERGALALLPLLLRPALTLLALASLAVRPTHPYGLTLPVALTQDWGLGQDLAAAAFVLAPTLVAALARVRVPPPRAWELGLLAFLAYALLSPAWARRWDAHTGNEPKTLRMAVALGHGLGLDVEDVSAGMEDLHPVPLGDAIRAAARRTLEESALLASALAAGPEAWGRHAIQATRISRQTVRGKDGGVYYVLAPGPSLLLAPLLRTDRALNRRAGTPGRLAVTLLAWNALSALLVVGLLILVRDATGRPGLAAAVAGGFALLPPFYFYSYQFYPEMLGALALVFLLHALAFTRHWSVRRAAALGALLATLPWLHQKFLPVWGVLTAWAVLKAVHEMTRGRGLLGLALPQVLTLAAFALYNFAVTGSARPDAVYLAWGPGGVSSGSTARGLPGLLFDARYGLLPYVPLYLAAGAGVLAASPGARRLRLALPAVLVYYLTVASADNWSGAGCNLGRYMMPIVPVLVAFVAIALPGLRARPGAMGLAATLAAWSALFALLLGLDPHAANDCSVLLARSVFADGTLYMPTLPTHDSFPAAPGLGLRVAAWVVLALLAAWALRPRTNPGGSPLRTLGAVLAVLVACAAVLERGAPATRGPRFPDALEARPGQTVFALSGARFENGLLVAQPGDVSLLVRQRGEGDLALLAAGEGSLRLPGQPPMRLTSYGLRVPLRAASATDLTGRRGTSEVLSRVRFAVDAPGPVAMQVLP